jgi:hypothetical protein
MTVKSTKRLGKLFEDIFQGVEADVLKRIADGSRTEEDHITSTFFTLIEERVNGLDHNQLKIEARQFTGRGPSSDESVTGADGAMILDVKFHNTEFRKVILLQAKNFSNRKARFDDHAIDQKYKMLYFTPDSYFMIYQTTGISFASALLIGSGDKLNQLPLKKAKEFLSDYFNCFIGDHLLTFPPDTWRRPWRYWPMWEEFRHLFKSSEKSPIAKNNILISVSFTGEK